MSTEEPQPEPIRAKRPRIPYKLSAPAVEDSLAFRANKATPNARKINEAILSVELWGDKHYFIRHYMGSDDGSKREGIDPHIVESLILRSIKYLFLYASTVRGFKFVHYEGCFEKPTRVVIQEEHDETLLNVVIETHFVAEDHFEITAGTAMCTNDFKIQNGQYVLEIQEGGSILKRLDNVRGKLELVEVCSL